MVRLVRQKEGNLSQKEFEIQINAEHRKIIRDIHSLMYDFGYVV